MRRCTSALRRCAFQRKTNITDATLGFATSGVLMPVRLPNVYGLLSRNFACVI